MRASVLHGLAAALLVASPAIAQAQAATPAVAGASSSAAQRLSLSSAPALRTGAAVSGRNRAEGSNWGWVVGAVAMVAGVTYALIETDDDDEPASP